MQNYYCAMIRTLAPSKIIIAPRWGHTLLAKLLLRHDGDTHYLQNYYRAMIRTHTPSKIIIVPWSGHTLLAKLLSSHDLDTLLAKLLSRYKAMVAWSKVHKGFKYCIESRKKEKILCNASMTRNEHFWADEIFLRNRNQMQDYLAKNGPRLVKVRKTNCHYN